jgi:5-oxoprolinase (ATP-hydrolysing) subunit A
VLIVDDHSRRIVDLNCDMGEGMPTDEQIYPFISSANIACGGHAGTADTMRRSVDLALQCGVAIGAHPSYPDKAGFGRTDILESAPGAADKPFSFDTLPATLTDQIETLRHICRQAGATLHHVKPHGALYNRAANDPAVSSIIAQAVAAIDPCLMIYGLSGSKTGPAAENAGLRYVNEVFADRTYQPDGGLTPRTAPNALIHDPITLLSQALTLVKHQQTRALNGAIILIRAETICLHGDGDDAATFASILRTTLERNGITIAAPHSTPPAL